MLFTWFFMWRFFPDFTTRGYFDWEEFKWWFLTETMFSGMWLIISLGIAGVI